MQTPCLAISLRDHLASDIPPALCAAVADSTAGLRGSLAGGCADAYSDIDVRWIVPDGSFDRALAELPAVVSDVQPIEYLRSDPDFQKSTKRRLLFLQLQDVPLFWRVDLEVIACSIRDQPDYDRDNPAARGDDWSYTHSALMNAGGAIKAMLRGRPAVAEGLLERAYQRIGLRPLAISLPETILDLVRQIVVADSTHTALANRVEQLYREVWA